MAPTLSDPYHCHPRHPSRLEGRYSVGQAECPLCAVHGSIPTAPHAPRVVQPSPPPPNTGEGIPAPSPFSALPLPSPCLADPTQWQCIENASPHMGEKYLLCGRNATKLR